MEKPSLILQTSSGSLQTASPFFQHSFWGWHAWRMMTISTHARDSPSSLKKWVARFSVISKVLGKGLYKMTATFFTCPKIPQDVRTRTSWEWVSDKIYIRSAPPVYKNGLYKMREPKAIFWASGHEAATHQASSMHQSSSTRSWKSSHSKDLIGYVEIWVSASQYPTTWHYFEIIHCIGLEANTPIRVPLFPVGHFLC